MNKLTELFNSIPDDELRQAISEIIDSEESGIIIEGGVIRKYARLSGEITGGITVTDFFLTQINLMKQASIRWFKSK